MKSLVVGLLASVLFATGCVRGMSQEEKAELLRAQLQISNNLRSTAETLVLAEPRETDSDAVKVAYQFRLRDLQDRLEDMQTNIAGPFLEYDYKIAMAPYEIGLRIWDSPNTGLILCTGPLLDCNKKAKGGGNFAFKNADFSGAKFDIANNESAIGKDEAVVATHKSSAAQDDGMAASDDGQNIDGAGNTQGQSVVGDSFPGVQVDDEGQFTPNSEFGSSLGL